LLLGAAGVATQQIRDRHQCHDQEHRHGADEREGQHDGAGLLSRHLDVIIGVS